MPKCDGWKCECNLLGLAVDGLLRAFVHGLRVFLEEFFYEN